MRFAVIVENIVVNVAEATGPLAPNWVASTTANIGQIYDGHSFTWPPTHSGG